MSQQSPAAQPDADTLRVRASEAERKWRRADDAHRRATEDYRRVQHHWSVVVRMRAGARMQLAARIARRAKEKLAAINREREGLR